MVEYPLMRNRREAEPTSPLPFWIGCGWETQPLTFGGFSAEEIARMVQVIGFELGITAEQAKRIKIFLTDHSSVKYGEDQVYITTAFCVPYSQPNGRYEYLHIILNRSLEVYQLDQKIFPFAPKTPAQANQTLENPADESGPLRAELESGEELLIWMITEELNHAQLKLSAGNVSRDDAWQNKYVETLTSRGIENDNTYNFELAEVTAARHALRLLEKFADDPQRQRYFRERYQESLRQRKAVGPAFPNSLCQTVFVPTGFKV
jgi:hypothetical protein